MARRYARDNRGRFSSTGATARGGRLRTAAGNKRATVTSSAGMVSQGRLTGAPLKGTIGKTSKARLNMGLTRPSKPGQREAYNAARTQIRAKPAPTKGARLGGTRRTTRAAAPRNTTANKTGQSKTLNKFNSRPVGTKILNAKNQLVASTTRVPLRVAGPGSRGSDRAFARVATKTTRLRAVNKRMGDRPDLAQVNIKGRFSGQAGKRMDASIDRAVKQVKAAEQARLMKPKEQVKAERAAKAEANRQAAAAKPKRIRSAESLRTSRAKQIEKRRSITTNPAGERASAAAKMAANAARTQQRATAFYKANASKKSAKAAPKPAAKPVPKAATSLQAVNARRARASAPRTSTYLSQKLNTQSAITRSAANAIYNRQRAVSKAGGLDKSVVRNPIGIMPKTSGSVRNRAAQVREAARKRVVGGRRR